jgi:3-methyl-2-oxobutanoate hydroxymethyltransferase
MSKTISGIKKQKSKIVMVTCYDYAFALAIDGAGVDIVLVGDSLANVVLGLKDTREVSINEMINHTRAVARGTKNACVITDAPYLAYQKNPQKALYYAQKFIAAGSKGVKIEWFKDCLFVVKMLIKNKIPAMGHIGLTPQTAHLLGGYKVQGKDRASALNLLEQAKSLEKAGVFSLVVECVPQDIGKLITDSIKIPTIGIGAGKYCDGQVLVLYDLLGLYRNVRPRFVRQYCDLFALIQKNVKKYSVDVKRSCYPSRNESYL